MRIADLQMNIEIDIAAKRRKKAQKALKLNYKLYSFRELQDQDSKIGNHEFFVAFFRAFAIILSFLVLRLWRIQFRRFEIFL